MERPIIDIDARFRSIDEWMEFFTAHPEIRERELISRSVEQIRKSGLHDPFLGWIPPREIAIDGDNFRETIECRGAKSRHRAVLHSLRQSSMPSQKLYASESLTPFASRLREHFVDAVLSEYLPAKSDRDRHPRVRHENVESLSFSDGSFDLYVSCEVFEHVPHLGAALNEARRVLRKGGRLLGTVPFGYMSASTLQKATLVNDRINYHCEPEYHHNPTDPEKGSLVFQIPGWDFLKQLTDAGFSDAHIRFTASSRCGIHQAELAGVLSFAAIA